jgi:hypothetical protein
MPLPWLRLIDAALGMADIARRVRGRTETGASEQLAVGAQGSLETRLAGVVVAALKEAFDRDHQRMEFERAQLESERKRADQALRLELARQAGGRELGRMQLLAGIAVVSWLGTLFFSARLTGGTDVARICLGAGWVLLLGALAAAFRAQSAISGQLAQLTPADSAPAPIEAGTSGALVPWLIVLGLAVIAAGALFA